MRDFFIYHVADMLGMPLHEMPDGKVRGAGTRMLTAGGWKFEAESVVMSDVSGASCTGYFARLHANLWLYIVVDEVSADVVNMEAYAFDAKMVDLRVKDMSTFGGKSIKATIAKLQPAIRSAFEYKATVKAWKELNVSNMVNVYEEQGT